MKIEVHIPDEMSDYGEDIRWFVETQVRKLHINRHKNEIPMTLGQLYNGLIDEVEELSKSVYKESQFEATLEAVDVANFAMLMGRSLLQMHREDYVKAPEASSFRDAAMRRQRVPMGSDGTPEAYFEKCSKCRAVLFGDVACEEDNCPAKHRG